MPRWCDGSRSRSSKPRPPNCARNGPGPGRCSIPNTASWRNMRACVRSRPSSRPNLPPRSSASSSASANSKRSARTDWTDELAAEAAQLEERRGEIDETIDGLAVYSDKDRARAGCIVTIGDDGEFCLHEGLVERAAVRGAAEAHAGDAGARDDDDGDEAFDSVAVGGRGRKRPQPALLPRRRAGAAQGMRLQPVAGRRSQGAPAADHPRASGGGFRGGVRSRALCAVRRSVRSLPLPLAPARSAGDRGGAAQFA